MVFEMDCSVQNKYLYIYNKLKLFYMSFENHKSVTNWEIHIIDIL